MAVADPTTLAVRRFRGGGYLPFVSPLLRFMRDLISRCWSRPDRLFALRDAILEPGRAFEGDRDGNSLRAQWTFAMTRP